MVLEEKKEHCFLRLSIYNLPGWQVPLLDSTLVVLVSAAIVKRDIKAPLQRCMTDTNTGGRNPQEMGVLGQAW